MVESQKHIQQSGGKKGKYQSEKRVWEREVKFI